MDLKLAGRPARNAELGDLPVVRPRTTAQQFVYESLRSAILTGQLGGGTHLVQEQIAQQLGVSRIPVREALLQLEADGFVRQEAHRGATVVWLSPAEIAELFDIRGVLMAEAARLVVSTLGDEQIDELERLTDRHDARGSREERAQVNRRFYEVLWGSLERPRLRSMIGKLEEEAARYFPDFEAPHTSHSHLLDAFRARDGARAAALIRDHLQEMGRRAESRARKMLEDA